VFPLYFDEDALDHALVSELRRAGFDCLTAAEAGMLHQPDERHLEYAVGAERVIYTNNTRDFRRLHTEWLLAGRRHSGIIALTYQRTPIGDQLRGLRLVADRNDSRDMRDQLLFLRNFL